MSGNVINASSLAGIDISPEGGWAEIHTRDGSNGSATVRLSIRCLSELLLLVPEALQTVMRQAQRDDSLRLTYPLRGFTLEFGELGERQSLKFILSLHSVGGFAVSFSGPADDLVRLANSVLDETSQLPRPRLPS